MYCCSSSLDIASSLSPMIRAHDVQQALSLITKARRVLCICHRAPDGDAIGSLLSMGLLLEQHLVNVPVLFHCIDAVPETFRFLPGVWRVRSDLLPQPGDAVIFLDCAEPKLTGYSEKHPSLFRGDFPVLLIDHHVSNPGFGTVNIIIPAASSTCEIVFQLAREWSWSLDTDSATCLLMGVYTDTGGLLHSNTTAEVYRTVSELMRSGARHQLVVSSVFRTVKPSTLRLWGRVLEKITISDVGGAISAVTEGDFRSTGAEYSELSGAIDYVNAVPGMRFSLVLSERDGVVKGSLRTLRDDIDVNAMASRLRGGGHRRAAGFAVPGRLQSSVHWTVVPSDDSSPSVGCGSDSSPLGAVSLDGGSGIGG